MKPRVYTKDEGIEKPVSLQETEGRGEVVNLLGKRKTLNLRLDLALAKKMEVLRRLSKLKSCKV